MADVPKGPGQHESTMGQPVNVPGLYRDPASGKYLHVVLPAGADALVRMGWELEEEGQEISTQGENKLASNNSQPTPDPETPAGTHHEIEAEKQSLTSKKGIEKNG